MTVPRHLSMWDTCGSFDDMLVEGPDDVRGSSTVERGFHTSEVGGSTPLPATDLPTWEDASNPWGFDVGGEG